MTAEPDLLPLPSVLLNWPHPTNHAAIRDYTRANVARATAARDAEVEALRAEVAGLTAQVEHHTAYTITHRGALRYCNSSMRDAYSEEHHRAERLAEALRLALKWAEVLPPGEPLRKESEADLSAARAALEQESNDA